MAYTTIDNPELYFQVKIYTGTGSSNALTLDGDENMQPDLVWNKIRSATGSHRMTDAVRGVTEEIYPDIPDAEDTQSEGVTAFGSNGFTVGTNAGYNTSSATYVAWCWKESATAGFDIVSYTGNGSNRTISHSLSAKPAMMIVKQRSASRDWWVYNKNLDGTDGATGVMYLSTSDAAGTGATTSWNSTAPTSSVFSLGTTVGVNASSGTYINYLFSEVQGYSKFGKYVGNADSDGPFIYTGFRPAFFLYKNSNSSSEEWKVLDNKRDPINRGSQRNLVVHDNRAESDDANSIGEFVSNGVKIRSSHNNINESGDTFIYMAFAEQPFVNSNGVPNNAR